MFYFFIKFVSQNRVFIAIYKKVRFIFNLIRFTFQVLLNDVQNCTVLKNAGSSISRGRMAASQGGVL